MYLRFFLGGSEEIVVGLDFSARGDANAAFGRALTRTLVDAGRRGVSATGAIVLDPDLECLCAI